MAVACDPVFAFDQFIDFDGGNCIDRPQSIPTSYNPNANSALASDAFAFEPYTASNDHDIFGLSYNLNSLHAYPELAGLDSSQTVSAWSSQQAMSRGDSFPKTSYTPRADVQTDMSQNTNMSYLGHDNPQDSCTDPFTSSPDGQKSKTKGQQSQLFQDEPAQGDQPKTKARRRHKKKQREPRNAAEFEKRTKFLERNRVAASKCRHKKKEYAQNLDEQAREKKAIQQSLGSQVDSLKQLVLYLKQELLRHAGCNCPEIKSYLRQQLGQISGTSNKCEHCSGAQNYSKPLSITAPESRRMSNASLLTSSTTTTNEKEDFNNAIASSDAEEFLYDISIDSPTGSVPSALDSEFGRASAGSSSRDGGPNDTLHLLGGTMLNHTFH